MIPHASVSTGDWRSASERPTAIPRRDVVLRVDGPGAEACLQGVLTNDLVRNAPSLVWGAVLTPKGMIITDLWVHRRADGFDLVVPEAGREPLLAVFKRSFPPRLAKVTDLGGELSVWWVIGTPAGTVEEAIVAEPTAVAPFDSLVLTPRAEADQRLLTAGCTIADEALGDVRAALAGWPAVGREIDEKTLPQEVRFDDLEGVKYDKGCYVGQETVARLHFRGHANRTLRAMPGHGELPEDPTVTTESGKEVGEVTTLVAVGDRWVASAKVRREVATGDRVIVGGRCVALAEFPVAPDVAGG